MFHSMRISRMQPQHVAPGGTALKLSDFAGCGNDITHPRRTRTYEGDATRGIPAITEQVELAGVIHCKQCGTFASRDLSAAYNMRRCALCVIQTGERPGDLRPRAGASAAPAAARPPANRKPKRKRATTTAADSESVDDEEAVEARIAHPPSRRSGLRPPSSHQR